MLQQRRRISKEKQFKNQQQIIAQTAGQRKKHFREQIKIMIQAY